MKVSNTIDLLCGTDAEAAALRQVQMKAADKFLGQQRVGASISD